MRKVAKQPLPPRVYRKMAKGHTYYYFVIGKSADGKRLLKRLPDIRSKDFGPAYSAAIVATSRAAPSGVVLITVRELAFKYEKSPEFTRRQPNTQKAYLTYLPKFVEQFGHAPAQEIERHDIVSLLDTFGSRTGAANMMLSVVGALYAWGRSRGHVTNNPTQDIEPHETKDYEPWPDALLAMALESDDELVRKATALLYFTAQRIGDVCGMRWSDVDGDRIYITQQKTKTTLDFPLHFQLREILGTPRNLGHILVNADGKPATSRQVRSRLQKWAAKHGEKVVPHGLRKNAVNALLEVGCSVAETSAISGQSLQIVEHYAKRRNRSRMGGAAILKWEGTMRERANR